MNVVTSTGQVILKNTQLVVRRPGMWPSSLIRREAGQVANDVTGDKSYSVFNSMVKGSQFEYDSRH